MIYDQKEIGKRIESERKKMGYTQKTLGNLIHTSDKQISNYEKGKLFPPIDSLTNLCQVFNCELGYLLGDPNYSNRTKLETAISEKYGFSETTLSVLNHLLTNRSSFLQIDISNSNRNAINLLLSSPSLPAFLSEINNYKRLVEHNTLNNLKKELGADRFRNAESLYHSSFDYMHEPYSLKLTEIQSEDLEKYCKAIDQELDYDIKKRTAHLYLHESCRKLIDEIMSTLSKTIT